MVVGNRVAVEQGTVVGGEGVLPNGEKYFYFQGIPYAVPPLGKLRFLAPVKLKRFAQPEIQCTKEGNKSYQFDMVKRQNVGSEDCLFLNVYAPQTKPGQSLPVMVYIHGGAFFAGCGNFAQFNPTLLLQEDVVVVTLNYRLGILGFLALPEANIPGNAGLKDQRLALQWIHENISKFNGDPNNVTIFGQSAGSVSVNWHILSDKSRKFFKKAIMHSGTANAHWAADIDPSSKTKIFAQTLGFTSTDPFEMAKFFQEYENLANFTTPVLMEDFFDGLDMPLRPVVEKESPEAIITKSCLQTLKDKDPIDVPIMMGYTSAEGIDFRPSVGRLNRYNENIRDLVPPSLNGKIEDSRVLELATSIKNFYFKGKDLSEDVLNEMVDLVGDPNFIFPAQEAARFLARKQRNSPLYFYRFDFVGVLNVYKKIQNGEHLKGATHTDELGYIFKMTDVPEPLPEREKKMGYTMCKFWTNFAKSGNPTPDSSLLGFTWEPFKRLGNDLVTKVLIIDDPFKIITNPDEDRMSFWRNVKEIYNV